MNKRILHIAAFCLIATTGMAAPVQAETGIQAAAPDESPSVNITVPAFQRAEGKLGETIVMGTIHISVANTTTPVMLEMRGADRTQFELSQTEIAPGTSETDITVSYKPTGVKAHKGNIIIESTDVPEASQSISLMGIAYDPANPPTVTLTPNALEPFSCEEKKESKQTFKVSSAQMAESVSITMAQKQVFQLSTSSVYKNLSQDITLTFAPKSVGEYKDTIIVSSYGMETQRIPVSGTATSATVAEEKEGDKFELSTENPLALLNEHFDSVVKNKPLSLTGWTNSAIEGKRAWWGYTFPDYDENPDESVAKVTPFDSKVEYGEETPCEMLLVTPALDYANAQSKMLTMRVRGDYLQDNQTDKFTIYYIEKQGENIVKSEMKGFNLPDTKDESGEWNEYHVNLANLDLADVFFIGFGFNSMRGAANSATYYIDDVSFGRTDLAIITPAAQQIAFEAIVGKENVTEEIAVTTQNTQNEVKLTVGGPNASKFKLSTKTLPKEGGTFQISFKSDTEGVHEAYIKLASRGAADQYIALSVNNKPATGISDLHKGEADTPATVFDLNGKKVLTADSGNIESLKTQLRPGIYIVRTGKNVQKLTVR